MKIGKKIAILLLALCLAVGSLSGCAKTGKTLLESEDGKIELSVNMFSLFLSRMKGILYGTYGEQIYNPNFWDGFKSGATTYNQFHTDQVLEMAKNNVIMLHAFDALGLKLPESYLTEIDTEMQELVDLYGEGSKQTFNGVLKEFGANYNVLREAYVIEAKIAYLKLHLYGENGAKVGNELVEQFYQKNYIRFKQVFLKTYRNVYVTDSNGDEVYYWEDGKIAYDKSAIAKKDANGEFVKDAKGDVIYLTEEGRIAYNKESGKRQNVYLEDGTTPMTEEITGNERQQIIDVATTLLSQTQNTPEGAKEVLFDELSKYVTAGGYNEDEGVKSYPNGYYITKDMEYISSEFVAELAEMQEGEVRLIQSDYGLHVVMRYEPDAGAYAKEENKDFFKNPNNGTYVFMTSLIEEAYAEYMERYVKEKGIVVHVEEDRLTGVDIKSVGVNFHY